MSITFEKVMNYCKPHNQFAYKKMKEACKAGRAIPFVGAGLSVFCGYLQWGTLLKELADYVPYEESKKEIDDLISTGKLLTAAQKIYDSYPFMIDVLPELIPYERINKCDSRKIISSADYVLPLLFKDKPVVTTNFDHVLEAVHQKQNCTFGAVLDPFDMDRMAQARQANAHALIKLHGDVGKDMITMDKLVFTEAQYEQHYKPDGVLVQELTKWFENKQLLFLGCSLDIDKTMEVLAAATEKNQGLKHFAVISCKKDELQKRINELGKLRILPIVYPDGDHEAVRVVLEKLLCDLDHEAYKTLPGVKIAASIGQSRLMYDAEYIKFTGRQEEMQELRNFCAHEAPALWWAVTGPGGMGKSRLVHEFLKELTDQGWGSIWLRSYDYGDLEHRPLCTDQPCIVVADDAQASIQELGKWMEKNLGNRCGEKLRILLLERDGKDLSDASWGSTLGAVVSQTGPIFRQIYAPEFLRLMPLSDTDLITVMKDYVSATTPTKPLADDHAERLLEALKKVDQALHRPVYAISIADAHCSGKDPTKWEQNTILDHLVDRELGFYYDRLRSVISSSPRKNLKDELNKLLATSCIKEPLFVTNVKPEDYPKLSKKADEADMDFPEFLRAIGVTMMGTLRVIEKNGDTIEKVEEKEVEAVLLQCPDLIKEYLVLRQAFERDKMDILLPEDWCGDRARLNYIRRLLVDYPKRLEGKSEFLERFFDGEPPRKAAARAFGDLLFGVTDQISKYACTAAERLEKLQNDYPNDIAIAVEYAKGLVNLSHEQDLDGSKDSVEKLRQLYEKDQFNNSAEIAELYVKALVNLSCKQDLDGCKDSVEKLRKLHESPLFENSVEIAEVYAMGLYNLSCKQDLDECKDSAEKLRKLLEMPMFGNSTEIAELYAKGLFNLSCTQDLDGCKDSADKLQKLQEKPMFRNSTEIAELYAKGLFNLSCKQDLDGCKDSVEKLRKLQETVPFRNSTEIAEVYAKGIFNLSNEQDLDGCKDSVEKLQKLQETNSFRNSMGIAVAYARGLVRLSVKQNLDGCKDSVEKLRQLHEMDQFKSSTEVAELYANGLGNLSCTGDLEGCRDAVKKLKQLCEKAPFRNSPEFVAFYVGSLPNLSFKQTSESDVQATLKEAKRIAAQYPDHEEVQCYCAMTWFNLTLQQTAEGIEKTIEELRDFLLAQKGANKLFQDELDKYLAKYPDHAERYARLRIERQ